MREQHSQYYTYLYLQIWACAQSACMKNKNEVTGNLLLGCTVLRITPEFPGAILTWMLESVAGMPGYRFQHSCENGPGIINAWRCVLFSHGISLYKVCTVDSANGNHWRMLLDTEPLSSGYGRGISRAKTSPQWDSHIQNYSCIHTLKGNRFLCWLAEFMVKNHVNHNAGATPRPSL